MRRTTAVLATKLFLLVASCGVVFAAAKWLTSHISSITYDVVVVAVTTVLMSNLISKSIVAVLEWKINRD